MAGLSSPPVGTVVEHLTPARAGTQRLTTSAYSTLPAATRTLRDGPGAMTLDEVQRAPEILRAVKRAIDRGIRRVARVLCYKGQRIRTMSRAENHSC